MQHASKLAPAQVDPRALGGAAARRVEARAHAQGALGAPPRREQLRDALRREGVARRLERHGLLAAVAAVRAVGGALHAPRRVIAVHVAAVLERAVAEHERRRGRRPLQVGVRLGLRLGHPRVSCGALELS